MDLKKEVIVAYIEWLIKWFKAQIKGDERVTKKQPAVYILSSKLNGTLYIGVTSNLVKRIWEHRNNVVDGFTKKYGVHVLVWYELHETMESAIKREKGLKGWKREWKVRMIEEKNLWWQDLYQSIL